MLVSVDITPMTVMFTQQEEKSAERYSQIKLMNHYYLEFAWFLFLVCLSFSVLDCLFVCISYIIC